MFLISKTLTIPGLGSRASSYLPSSTFIHWYWSKARMTYRISGRIAVNQYCQCRPVNSVYRAPSHTFIRHHLRASALYHKSLSVHQLLPETYAYFRISRIALSSLVVGKGFLSKSTVFSLSGDRPRVRRWMMTARPRGAGKPEQSKGCSAIYGRANW